jgi:hypothetical protein
VKTVEQHSLVDRLVRRQWSFFWAGVVFGVAQIIYMVALWLQDWNGAGQAESTPITVTTDLGKMFRGMEMFVYQLFNLPDFELYGTSVGGIANGGAFVPGVGWPIVGMVIGGYIVARLERENRTWVKYSPRILAISFLGGILFSYGTRLAGGCTLNHLLGGLPMMSIGSTFTVLMMAMGGGLAFLVMSKLNVASNFKHQETRSYLKNNDAGEAPLYDPHYRPTRRPIYWISLAFVLIFFGVAIWGGLLNPQSLQHLKDGEMAAFGKSIDAGGWALFIGTLAAGIVAGIGMAKSGFGTECALVAAESAGAMTKKDAHFARMGVPRITRTLMRGYIPMIGVAASWIVMLTFMLAAWVFFGIKPGFEGGVKEQFTAGNLVGGLLLGMGAVLLIGCEIRSYMRIGLGYLNTWVGFMGFAVGYLPYTLFEPAHIAFQEATLFTSTHKWYQLAFPDNIAMQQAMLFGWLVLIVLFVGVLIRKGTRNTGLDRSTLLNRNMEDMQTHIDLLAARNGGRIGGVMAPLPVPPGTAKTVAMLS